MTCLKLACGGLYTLRLHPVGDLLPGKRPTAAAANRLFLSGNDAVAHAARDAGVRVAAAYPARRAPRSSKCVGPFPRPLRRVVAPTKKVASKSRWRLDDGRPGVQRDEARGAQRGLRRADDLTVTGVEGGLVIAVATWNVVIPERAGFALLGALRPRAGAGAGRFPGSHDMTRAAFRLSEQFRVPVILRLTTRICHVKGRVGSSPAETHEPTGFVKDPRRWVMVPGNAKPRLPLMFEREAALRAEASVSPLNRIESGSDRRIGFVTSGPAMHAARPSGCAGAQARVELSTAPDLVRELAAGRNLAGGGGRPNRSSKREIKAAGIACVGKDVLPRLGGCPKCCAEGGSACAARPCPKFHAAAGPAGLPAPAHHVCGLRPHLGIYYTLSQAQEHHHLR